MQDLRLGERELVSTDHQQEAPPERQLHAIEETDASYSYAVKSQTHLWILTIVHRTSDQMLDAFDGDTDDLPLLDVDTIVGPPMIGCLICEKPYERRLRMRKCTGEPKR